MYARVHIYIYRCKQYSDGDDESVKTFRELSIKASTNVVNETENRLLKSGKDRKNKVFKRNELLIPFANRINMVPERC